MNEKDTAWFRPLWRRVAVTAVVVLWLGFEVLYGHDQLWMGIAGVALVYCVWNFFLRFPKDVPPAPPAEPPA
jgi:hypothetical protein